MERRLPRPHRKNPYRGNLKPAGHTKCLSCAAIHLKGKWFPAEKVPSNETPGPTSECPACRQRRDRYAMGVIELRGEGWKKKADQVFRTIDHTEQIARARNDQERVLWSQAEPEVTQIYVSLPELARQIGRSLRRALKGRVRYLRTSEDPFLRVVWNSDESGGLHPAREPRRSRNGRRRGAA